MHEHDHKGSILIELGHHLPYSTFSVLAGMVLVTAIAYAGNEGVFKGFFHLFHPGHLLLSAAATTGMFWRYKKRIVMAIGVGFVGSAGICGISDVILPYLGGLALGQYMEFHICFVEHPLIVVPFVFAGIAAGILAEDFIKKSTVYSHSGHVLVSSIASTLYLISFGVKNWLNNLGWIFLIVVICVMLPCCFSDIIFPLLIVKDHDHDEE